MGEDRASAPVVAIVQARMRSSRLPGKVLEDIGGRPAILLLLRRLGGSRELSGVVVATSEDPADDALAAVVAGAGERVVRGPLDDVLERYRIAAAQLPCDAVARITGDCPLIDGRVVDRVIRRWRRGDEDFVTNTIEPRTSPDGQDVEVISRAALESAAAEAREPGEREHVTPFVRSHPERFRQVRVDCAEDWGRVRMTLDTPRDLEAIRALVARTGPDADLDALLSAAGATPGVAWPPRASI